MCARTPRERGARFKGVSVMNTKDRNMLTFELHASEDSNEIAIHGSPQKLEKFASDLLRLVKNTKEGHFNHDHLYSDEWGGDELSSVKQSEESELINHVKIYCWKGSKFQT